MFWIVAFIVGVVWLGYSVMKKKGVIGKNTTPVVPKTPNKPMEKEDVVL